MDPELPTDGLPLVVAVSGHRDLPAADLPAIRARISAFFQELRADYPHTPLRLLSALAEGADRVAAEVALELGVELVVPLPMPADLYERDFPGSRESFQALLDAAAREDAERVFTLPLAPGNSSDAIAAPGAARDRQYEQLAAYLARHAHLLLALWDGDRTEKPGGTAQAVRFKLEGVTGTFGAGRGPLDVPDTGPVYHVPVRRSSASGAADAATSWLYPERRDSLFRDKLFRFIDDFNARGAELPADEVAESRGYVLPADTPLDLENRRMLEAYARADRLAIGYRTLTHRFVGGILVLAGTMALAFETYAHLLVERPVLVLYLLCFVAIAGLYRWNRKLFAKSRYLDYRALAEGLRVQLFWRLSGVGEHVAAHYLTKQSGELQWIREALRGVSAIPARDAPRHDLVEQCWIRDQGRYFAHAAERDHHKMERLETLADWLYGTGLAISVAVIIFWGALEEHLGLHHVLIVVMGFLPVVAALWTAYAEKTALREQSKQYDRMAIVYRRAIAHIDALRGGEADGCGGACLDELALALGREALMENGDWVMLHRERPIEIPKGG